MNYTRDEAIKSLKKEGFLEIGANVVADKYLLKDIDDPTQFLESTYWEVCDRVAEEASEGNTRHKKILFDLFYSRAIIPGGSILSGLGSKRLQSLSNCFVIPPAEDDYGSIINADANQVNLMKRRGGVGHDLSRIRPKGMPVNNSALVSTGVVPFMKRFSNSTQEVSQDGRRGALMLTISVYHPDVLDFINAKRDLKEINGANISVRVDDNFMEAVKNDDYYLQRFPIDKDEYSKIEQKVKAREVFKEIVESMRVSAEPGILFWDKITEIDKNISSTNPCGEVPIPQYDSCILSHVNLFSCVDDPFTNKAKFNYNKFREVVKQGAIFLDIIVDKEIEQIDKILKKLALEEESTRQELELYEKIKEVKMKTRRIGQGITGYADFKAAMMLTYVEKGFINEVMKIKNEVELKTSEELYYNNPNFLDIDIPQEVIDSYNEKYGLNLKALNNIALSTIAPVGTGSLITGTASGMEPVFKISHERRTISSGKEVIYNIYHSPYREKYKKYISAEKVQHLYEEAHEIDVKEKIELQSVLQHYTHMSISVTHNLPKGTSSDEIEEYILLAHEKGLKGFTVYVDGSREGILGTNLKKENRDPKVKRGISLEGKIHRLDDQDTFIVGFKDGIPYEIFSLENKELVLPEGNCTIHRNIDRTYTLKTLGNGDITVNLSNMYTDPIKELITRHISKRIRNEGINEVIRDFDKCLVPFGTFEHRMYRTLRMYTEVAGEKCPNCGKNLKRVEGCMQCSCGYSKC